MTAEQRVKKVYPYAFISEVRDMFGVVMIVLDQTLGNEIGRSSQRRASWAWADAWSRIQAQRKVGKV